MEKNILLPYLKERLAALLEIPAQDIKEQDRFSALGLNSAKATLFSVELSEKLQKKISPTVFYAYTNLQELVQHLTGESIKNKKTGSSASKLSEEQAIAIVGMSCRFPKASNLRAFWDLLNNEINAITEIPRERWNIDEYFDEDATIEGKIQTRYGGFVEDLDVFDPYFFDISPREAAEMSPDQKMCMELAWEAFTHAKIKTTDLAGSPTGVFIGNVWNDFSHLRIKKRAPINQHSAIGQSANIIANRISYSFGFQGPSLVVDTACSSSLYAVHLACQAIRQGDCEMALAGGVNIMLDPDSYIYMSKFGGLSPTGQCHTFDANADGYVRGEGGGMIVLKSLSQALKDGDRVYAVVRGSAVNNDGASNSLTAPNLEAQKEVLRVAYQRAGISPQAVHYIETHGTGTKLGDPIEAEALGIVLGEQRKEHTPLLLGSVKTNIGHLEGAAGIAGIIKVVLAIQKQKLPRSLNFQTPNPYIPFEDWKLKVLAEAQDWITEPAETRKAGISGFGWGGTNAHVVLEEFVETKPEILVLSGNDDDSLFKTLLDVKETIESSQAKKDNTPTLKSLCAIYANQPTHRAHRIALKAETIPELYKKIIENVVGDNRTKYTIVANDLQLKTAFLLSPFGGQYIGMGINLLENDKNFRAKFKSCDFYFKKISSWSLLDKINELNNEDLERTDIIIPLIFAIQISLAEMLAIYGILPDVVIGHSMGEISAACIAGFITLEDSTELVYHYSRLLHTTAGNYAMAVVNKSVKLLEKDFKNYTSIGIAGINSEDACNISGFTDEIDRFVKQMNNEGFKATKINIAVPAHTHHVRVYLKELETCINHIKPIIPKTKMYSTLLNRYINWEDLNAQYWCENIEKTVLLADGLYTLLKNGINNFIELSPHPVLKHYVNQAVSHTQQKATVHHALERGKDEVTTFQNLLMLLYLQGFDVRWDKLYSKYWIADFQNMPSINTIEYNEVLVLPISAKTEQAVKDYARSYIAFMQESLGDTQKEIYDLCATTALKKTVFDYRLCITGRTKNELIENTIDFLENPNSVIYGNLLKDKKMAFVFSGQGPQWLGMGQKLMQEFDVFRESIEECNRAFGKYTDWSLVEQLYAQQEDSMLNIAHVLQPCLFAIQVSLAKLWISWGIVPDSVVGHSMGEVAAAYIAGILKLDDAAKIICKRSELMRSLSGKGAMLAVELSYEDATEQCKQYTNLEVAVNNSPQSCIIGGDLSAIEIIEADLIAQQIYCKRVKMDVASHTFHMDGILEKLLQELEIITPNHSEHDFYSSVEARKVETEILTEAYWVKNVRHQVLFTKTIEQMVMEDHAVFVEVSPHPVLSMPLKESLKQLDKEKESLVVGSTLRNQPEEEELMRNMAQLFAVGANIRWKKFYKTADSFVEMPQYPWNRERFTIQDRSDDYSYSLKRNDGSLGHPFLEQYIELAGQEGVDVWETRLLVENVPFLYAYKANGVHHFPTAAYLEMLEAAMDELYSKADYASHSLYIQKPIILNEGHTPILQLKVYYINDKSSKFEIFVANLKDKSFKKRHWDLVAHGEIQIAETIITFPRQPIRTLIGNSKELFSKKGYYNFLENHLNLYYESDYRCVEKIWTIEERDGQARRILAQAIPTEKIRREQSKYKIHPLLIGSCIRTMFVIMPEEMLHNSEEYEYFVASMEQMYIANQDEYQAPFWAECELLDYEAEKIEGEGVVGNFTLYDNGGNVIAKSYNFRLGRKLKEITNPPLYELMWQKRALPALTHKNKDLQTTLIFSQGDKLSKAITQELRNFGHRVITIMPKFAFKADYKQGVLEAIYINPTQQADFISIAEVLKQEHITVNQIVYGWALQDKIDNERDIADVEHRLSFYNLGVLYLMQSYQHFPILPTTRLDILTVGAYPVEEGQATKSIASTTLWGLAKVIRQEYPTLACQTIDTMGYTTELDAKNLAYQLLYQMPEPEIALRKDSLYLPRLQNVLEEYVSKTPVELQAESTYMWVGSPNLLALAFIEWLAYKGAKNIVWIHQTLPSDNSTGLFMYLKKNDVKLTLIQIEDLDETSLEDCLENIRAKMPPLKGIFYAPVYTKQITLQDLDAQILGETWVEKIHGAWNLHRLTLQDNLEHFVMFSSANSLLGAPKTGAEVLANNALDALAHYRAGQNLPALSINWGTVVEAQEQPIPYIQEVDAKRYTMFFEKVLEAGMTQVGIFHLTSLPQTPYYELIKLTHKPIEQVVENTVTISKFEEWCLFTDRHKQMQWLEAQIREQTAIILKSSPNKVNVNTPFKTLGIDSIMTVQLRNLLEKTFDLKLPVSSFFSYSSIKEYTKFLDEQLCSILPAPAVKEITPKPTRAEKTEQTAAAPIQDFSAMSLEELSKALDEELSGAL